MYLQANGRHLAVVDIGSAAPGRTKCLGLVKEWCITRHHDASVFQLAVTCWIVINFTPSFSVSLAPCDMFQGIF